MRRAIRVMVDTAQTRIKKEPIRAVITGFFDGARSGQKQVSGWDKFYVTKDGDDFPTAWVEPLKGTLMLMPLCLTPEWQTNGSGKFERLGIANFDLSTPNFKEMNPSGGASKYLHSLSSVGTFWGKTKATWPKNQPFVISNYLYGWGGDVQIGFEFGWSETPDVASGVAVRCYTNGTIEIWKDGDIAGTYSGDHMFGPAKKAEGWQQLLAIPARRRDLLLITNTGAGICHTFEDIDETEVDPEITPASSKFWWQVYGQTQIEIAPMRFRTSAKQASITYCWTIPPATDAPESTSVIFDAPGFGTCDATGALIEDGSWGPEALFVPNGTKRKARLRAHLTGDGDATPFVHAIWSGFNGETAQTDSTKKLDITGHVAEITFEVPDDPLTTKAAITILNPSELEDLGGGKTRRLHRIVNRPWQFQVNRGTTEMPNWVAFMDLVNLMPTGTPTTIKEAHALHIDLRDWGELLRRYKFRDRFPLDDTTIDAAINYLAAGIPSGSKDFDTFTLKINNGPSRSSGDWGFIVKEGETPEQKILQIFREYIPDCYLGIRPTATGPKLTLFEPDTIDAEEVVHELFSIPEDALTYLTDTLAMEEADAVAALPYYTFECDDISFLAPEANEVWVQGMELRTHRPILRYKRDTAAQNPEVAVGDRSDTWSGDPNVYGFGSPNLNTVDQVEESGRRLYDRLAHTRELWTVKTSAVIFRADNGMPLWKPDRIALNYRRRSDVSVTRREARIQALQGRFTAMHGDPGLMDDSEATYTVMMLDGDAKGLGNELPGAVTAAAMRNLLQQARESFGLRVAKVDTRNPRLSAEEVP